MSIDIGVRQPARFLRNFDAQALNPQPLPPKGEAAFAARISNLANTVALNPQPLPPKGETAFSAGLSTSVDSVVMGLAKNAGLGPILDKIKAVVKPLLDKVLQKAIGKLP